MNENLLSELTKFYRDEAAGLGHYDEDLESLAWHLAEAVRDLSAYNTGRLDDSTDVDDRETFVERLIDEHTTTLIDTAVNLLHHALLESAGDERIEALDKLFGEDIRSYLLHREDEDLAEELDEYDAGEAEMDDFD